MPFVDEICPKDIVFIDENNFDAIFEELINVNEILHEIKSSIAQKK